MASSPAKSDAQPEDGLDVGPPVRQRVADHVFETLAAAILHGSIKPGDPMPTQRELARRFNISALVVRQAIHRLEDLGLVRVRQGSPTIVLDPRESSDIRLIQLRMEMTAPDQVETMAIMENQLMFLVPMLSLAERRITPEGLSRLGALVAQVPDSPDAQATREFRRSYWEEIAAACGNPLMQQTVRWYNHLGGRDDGQEQLPLNLDVYRGLNERLANKTGAAQLWMDVLRPLLDARDAQLAGGS